MQGGLAAGPLQRGTAGKGHSLAAKLCQGERWVRGARARARARTHNAGERAAECDAAGRGVGPAAWGSGCSRCGPGAPAAEQRPAQRGWNGPGRDLGRRQCVQGWVCLPLVVGVRPRGWGGAAARPVQRAPGGALAAPPSCTSVRGQGRAPRPRAAVQAGGRDAAGVCGVGPRRGEREGGTPHETGKRGVRGVRFGWSLPPASCAPARARAQGRRRAAHGWGGGGREGPRGVAALSASAAKQTSSKDVGGRGPGGQPRSEGGPSRRALSNAGTGR
jgi:hypothetical protein